MSQISEQNNVVIFPNRRTAVKRVNTWSFYSLGALIRPLTLITWDSTINDHFLSIYSARTTVQQFLTENILDVPLSKTEAATLLECIDKILPDGNLLEGLKFEDKVEGHGYRIAEAAKKFEHVLAAELGAGDTYYVTQKGIYQTSSLIETAIDMFPDDVKNNLSNDAKKDICMAGKCLAFELPTACGFHITRAIEDVVRAYYKKLSGNPLSLENRSWGSYLIQLEKLENPDEKVIGILKQIKDMHRNPIAHPDQVLSLDEAQNLLGIGQSVITALITEIVKSENVLQAIPESSEQTA